MYTWLTNAFEADAESLSSTRRATRIPLKWRTEPVFSMSLALNVLKLKVRFLGTLLTIPHIDEPSTQELAKASVLVVPVM